MLGLAVALLVGIAYVLPTMQADTTRMCAASADPLHNLDSLFVWAQPVGEREPYLVVALGGMHGLEGQLLTTGWNEPRVCTVWVETQDANGHRSCPSNLVGVNLTLSVPPGLARPSRARWYDVTGRHLDKPGPRGVYFVRDTTGVRRVVVR